MALGDGHQPRIVPTTGCSFVARVAFDWHEQKLRPGDAFDWRAHGMVEEQALELWRAALIDVPPAAAHVGAAPTPKSQQATNRRGR